MQPFWLLARGVLKLFEYGLKLSEELVLLGLDWSSPIQLQSTLLTSFGFPVSIATPVSPGRVRGGNVQT